MVDELEGGAAVCAREELQSGDDRGAEELGGGIGEGCPPGQAGPAVLNVRIYGPQAFAEGVGVFTCFSR